MTIWARVPWTEAAQILALLSNEAAQDGGLAATSPKQHFDTLVASGAMVDAANFLSLALPRLEAVHWAARILRDAAIPRDKLYRRQLSDGINRWLDDPSDAQRRALWSLVAERSGSSPQWLLASAIFFSGGSIAPEDIAPVQPPQGVCGKLAACAVIASAYETPEPENMLRSALAVGDMIANQGL